MPKNSIERRLFVCTVLAQSTCMNHMMNCEQKTLVYCCLNHHHQQKLHTVIYSPDRPTLSVKVLDVAVEQGFRTEALWAY